MSKLAGAIGRVGDAKKGRVCDNGIGLGKCLMQLNCVAQGFITAVSGCVEREVSESVGVRVVGRRAWEREAECPVQAVLDDVRVRGS